ncbi:sulfatase-like hydrolase/transferase [Algibacter lectus]|uniref:Arylsulfatase A-like enzyme n=1 Tax=Algibacter lectus TaxID=221126 RepID=A0A4R8MFS3_9FLAO|nr:sulfatase-like hydrolase/transferase [Algibacter lectus]MWW25281.1 sulfatase-like hydrolase/transferase [Algibacter lectus]TDY64304.1 arylsulfatase A-like enzyme [Algibacter lectus]
MKQFKTLKLVLGAFLISCSILNVSAQKKNIIFLFADDAGYHDFGFQGSKTFPTPNLDNLASEGMVFNEAYTTDSVCGPSRAGLLTGMYQQRYGIEENNVPGYMSDSSKLLGDEMGLPLGINTVADYLNPLGYKSIVLGKWHLGNADRYHPLNRGFDEFYGFRGGARSFWPLSLKAALDRPEDRMEKGFGLFEEPKKYLTDAIADEACDFMERHKEDPFFMYVSFNAVHSPLEATDEDLAKIKGLTGNRKKLAAMTLALDRACGTILKKLKALGLEENTLIVFSNDNGGPDGTETSNYPLSGCKSNFLEGGIRVPFIMKLPGVIKRKTEYKKAISMLDMVPTFVNIAGGNASELKGLDGVDLMPFITKKNNNAPHERLFWKIENRGVVREGDWKLLRYPDRPAELYNIAEDITENNDLALKHPEKVREMYKTLFNWEAELERPLWQLKRIYEVNAVKRIDEKRNPVLDK